MQMSRIIAASLTRRRKQALPMAIVVATLAIVGCGGSDSNSGSGTGTNAAELASEAEVSDAQLGETVRAAFLTDVPASDLPAEVVDGLTVASRPLSDAQLDAAYACWQKNSCKLGDGDLTVGVADGYGGDIAWRKFVKMETILQALHYPNIGNFIYTDAGGDLTKMQSNVRNLSVQGADVILTFDDFGAAAGPAFRQAQQRGAIVSSYVSKIDGVTPEDVKLQTYSNMCQAAKDMVDVAAAQFGEDAKIAHFGGTPGNPQSLLAERCKREQIADAHPEMELVYSTDTSWTPAGTQKSAAGLISSGRDVDAITAEYADPLTQVLRAYESAGKSAPALITVTENNGLTCEWADAMKKGTTKAALTFTNGGSWAARVALTSALREKAGNKVPNQTSFPLPMKEASPSDCQPDKPADFPGNSSLVPPQLTERMLGSS